MQMNPEKNKSAKLGWTDTLLLHCLSFKNVSSFSFLFLLPSSPLSFSLLSSLFSPSLTADIFPRPCSCSASFRHAQSIPAAVCWPGTTRACSRSHAEKRREMEAPQQPQKPRSGKNMLRDSWEAGRKRPVSGFMHTALCWTTVERRLPSSGKILQQDMWGSC